MMAKEIPMGPRLGLLFTDLGDKINDVPDSARRELNDYLTYTEGQERIYKLVAFLIHQVPMPECVIEEQAEVADTGRPEPDTELVTLDDERDEDEDNEPEIDPDDGVEETIPTDPPPKRSQVRADPKRRSWQKPKKKSDPPSPEVQG